jgi:catechol 2,3-dioxygenase-like lactoylglutathione lyase family enzyme
VEFDHIGIPASEKHEGMRFLESKRLWLTSPADHPYRVEWLWYEEGSPEAELVRKRPHVAFRVDSLEEAMAGGSVISEPFDVFGEVRVGFIEVDGAPIEFVQPL